MFTTLRRGAHFQRDISTNLISEINISNFVNCEHAPIGKDDSATYYVDGKKYWKPEATKKFWFIVREMSKGRRFCQPFIGPRVDKKIKQTS
jgi:hypothetical protein